MQGGALANVIAESVELRGTVRSLDESARRQMLDRMHSIVECITRAMGGSFELQIEAGYPALINHKRAVDIIKNNGALLLGAERVLDIEKASLGVEDFAHFLQNTEGAFFRLGSGCEIKKSNFPIHSNLFDIDEDCLIVGVKLQVMNALEYLSRG
jgi:metal-dependent amidase/aminoacylase/carboxypeptidase family protein